MIYCDTAYLLKYHLDEPDSDAVRQLIDNQTGVSSLSFARIELLAAFHRKFRERLIDTKTHRAPVGQLVDDHRDGLWS